MTGVCTHKNEHCKKINRKFAPSGEVRPDFMVENELWRGQLAKAREDNGGKRLRNGQTLPVGVRRGWGASPGHDDVMCGSPGRHGDWRLVWIPKVQLGNDDVEAKMCLERKSGVHGGSEVAGEGIGISNMHRGVEYASHNHVSRDQLRTQRTDHEDADLLDQERLSTGRMVEVINRTLAHEKGRNIFLPPLSECNSASRSFSVPLAERSARHIPGSALPHTHTRNLTSGIETGGVRQASPWEDGAFVKSRVKQLK